MSKELTLTQHTAPTFFEILMDTEKLKALEEGCKRIAQSDFIPISMKKNPMNILIAMQMGMQLGIPELQALQDIEVINGKPCLYGDGFAAVVMRHPQYQSRFEKPIYNNDGAPIGYECTVIRKGHEPHTKTYTFDDARKSQLLGKAGQWTKNPLRMCQMRARSFALRDMFPDALRGVASAEEQLDYIEGELINRQDSVNQATTTVNDQKQLTQTERVKQSYKSRKGTVNDSSDKDFIEVDAIQIDVDSEKASENEKSDELGKIRRQENKIDNSGNKIEKASESQIEVIENLVFEKDFPPERMRKALNHYGVALINELTFEQADDFIGILYLEIGKK